MPAVSERQRRFFGAELGRKRRGQKTETGLSEGKLRDFARMLKHRKKKRERQKMKDAKNVEELDEMAEGTYGDTPV